MTDWLSKWKDAYKKHNWLDDKWKEYRDPKTLKLNLCQRQQTNIVLIDYMENTNDTN